MSVVPEALESVLRQVREECEEDGVIDLLSVLWEHLPTITTACVEFELLTRQKLSRQVIVIEAIYAVLEATEAYDRYPEHTRTECVRWWIDYALKSLASEELLAGTKSSATQSSNNSGSANENLSPNFVRTLRDYAQLRQKFYTQHRRLPDAIEFRRFCADWWRLQAERTRSSQALLVVSSMDEPREDERDPWDIIPDAGAWNPEQLVATSELRTVIQRVLDAAMEESAGDCRLTPRERELIVLFFGMNDDDARLTLENASEKVGLRRERGRSVFQKALRKLCFFVHREYPDLKKAIAQ